MSEINLDAEFLPPELPDDDELNEILSGTDTLSSSDVDLDDASAGFSAAELLGTVVSNTIQTLTPTAIGSTSVGNMGDFSTQAQVREKGSYRMGPRVAGLPRSESPTLEVAAAFENEDGTKRLTVNFENFLRLEEAVIQGRKAYEALVAQGLEPTRFASVLNFHLIHSDPGPQGNRPPWKLLYRGIGNSGEIRSQAVGADIARRQTPPGKESAQVLSGGASQAPQPPKAPAKTTAEDVFGLSPIEEDDPFR